MKKFNTTFLWGFGLGIGFLMIIPLFFSQAALLETNLPLAFCRPWDCGGFGLGENGMNLLLHTLTAAQMAIGLSLLVCTTSFIIGVPLGLCASLYPKHLEPPITLTTNLFLGFPNILLAIALSAFLGQGLMTVWFILSLTGWAPFCRLTRAAALQVQTQEFVQAAFGIGCPILRISLKHILPNIFPILLVHAAFQLSGIIIVESTLSFLGLGLPQETPSLGRLIFIGKQYILEHPHVALIPGIFVVVLVMGFYLSGMILDERRTRREF